MVTLYLQSGERGRGGESEKEGEEGGEERREAGILLTFSFPPFNSAWDPQPWNGVTTFRVSLFSQVSLEMLSQTHPDSSTSLK